MTLANTLAVAALVASVLLLVTHQARIPAIVAAVASGLEVLIALGMVRIHVAHLPLGLILGASLAVAGVLVHLKAAAKVAVSAATVTVLVGAVQVLRGLRVF